MILMCIAIHGDNEPLAQAELARLCEHMRADGTGSVYRAWTRRVSDRSTIDNELDVNAPHEVKP